LATGLLYLNTVTSGGETVFPAVGVGVRPKAGMMVIFTNFDHQGKPLPTAVHRANSVHDGVKVCMNFWLYRKMA